MLLQVFLQNPNAVGLQSRETTVGGEECVRWRKAGVGGEAFCPASRENPGKGRQETFVAMAWGQASHEPAFAAVLQRSHGKKPGAYASCQPGRWAPGFSRVVTAANCPGTVSNET